DHGQESCSGLVHEGTHIHQETRGGDVSHVGAFDRHLNCWCTLNINGVAHVLCFEIHAEVKGDHFFLMTDTLDDVAYATDLSWLDTLPGETHRFVSDDRYKALFKIIHMPLEDMR